jgi:hypothetical protein
LHYPQGSREFLECVQALQLAGRAEWKSIHRSHNRSYALLSKASPVVQDYAELTEHDTGFFLQYTI